MQNRRRLVIALGSSLSVSQQSVGCGGCIPIASMCRPGSDVIRSELDQHRRTMDKTIE